MRNLWCWLGHEWLPDDRNGHTVRFCRRCGVEELVTMKFAHREGHLGHLGEQETYRLLMEARISEALEWAAEAHVGEIQRYTDAEIQIALARRVLALEKRLDQ